jgi:putative ABC transport system substrate-binding protein
LLFATYNHKAIIAAAARHRVPTIYPFAFFVASGGLVAYGCDITDLWRCAASYLDRILRGERARDLPAKATVKFELAINLKTAKTLGLEVPAKLLALADEAIE